MEQSVNSAHGRAVQRCQEGQNLSIYGKMGPSTRSQLIFQLLNISHCWWTGWNHKLMMKHSFLWRQTFLFPKLSSLNARRFWHVYIESLCTFTCIISTGSWALELNPTSTHATNTFIISSLSLILSMRRSLHRYRRWQGRFALISLHLQHPQSHTNPCFHLILEVHQATTNVHCPLEIEIFCSLCCVVKSYNI